MTLVLALAFIAVVALSFLDRHRTDNALAVERARVSELLELLEAKAAPQEFYALSAPDSYGDEAVWVTDETGLIVFPVDEDYD